MDSERPPSPLRGEGRGEGNPGMCQAAGTLATEQRGRSSGRHQRQAHRRGLLLQTLELARLAGRADLERLLVSSRPDKVGGVFLPSTSAETPRCQSPRHPPDTADFNRSITNIGNRPPRFRSSHTFRASILA
jgi:hypothetical protein